MTNEEWKREAFKQQKENRELINQLREANETIDAIQKALELGPYNDWADRSIKRYQEKYSEIGE